MKHLIETVRQPFIQLHLLVEWRKPAVEKRYFWHRTSKKRKFIIPVILALFIGIIFGYILLYLFTNVGNEQNNYNLGLEENEENNAEIEATHDSIQYETDELSAFVLQAGMFSEQENAKERQKNFEKQNIKSMIWEREGFYYLFVDVSSTKKEAEEKINNFQEDIDLFIKEWNLPSHILNVSEAEKQWLKEFHNLWKQTVARKNLSEEWKQLLDVGGKLQNLSSFISEIKQLLTQEEENDFSLEYFLLKSWKEYEKMLITLKQ